MRAVNLVPAAERRGAGGAAGRSGGAAYVLLGLLAVLVGLIAVSTATRRSVADTRAEVTSVSAQAASAEARAAALTSFSSFAGLRAARTQTVSSLAASRFDWSHALGEVARVIPANVSLTSLQGTIAPGVTLKSGGSGTTSTLRSAIVAPAIELAGCTSDQDSVARMLTRMRLIDGVTRVSLQSSAKPAAQGGGATGGGSAGADAACRRGRPGSAPSFGVVVFFDQAAGSVPTTASGAGRVRASAFTPAPAGATGPTGAAPGGTP